MVLTKTIVNNRKLTKSQARRVSLKLTQAIAYQIQATKKKNNRNRISQYIDIVKRNRSEKIQRARGSIFSIRLLRKWYAQVTSIKASGFHDVWKSPGKATREISKLF
jgi:hypothetical protein